MLAEPLAKQGTAKAKVMAQVINRLRDVCGQSVVSGEQDGSKQVDKPQQAQVFDRQRLKTTGH